MLDLYLIDDIELDPDSAEESRLPHLGTVGKREFRDLQKMGVMTLKQDYWSDFRWESKKVLSILADLENNNALKDPKNPHFYRSRLLELLRKAAHESAGIIAFSD